MPESFVPVWMSLGEAQFALDWIGELPHSVEHPERLWSAIRDALEDEPPRSFDEMERERGVGDA